MGLPLPAGLAFVIVMAAPLEVGQGTSAACRWEERAALAGQVRTASRPGFCAPRADSASSAPFHVGHPPRCAFRL